MDATFNINVDNICVSQCTDSPSAVLLYMGVLYIFNLGYPAKIKSTLNFLQQLLLEITGTKDQNVVKLIRRIKQERNV